MPCSSHFKTVDTNKWPEVRTGRDPSQGPTPINGEDVARELVPVVIYKEQNASKFYLLKIMWPHGDTHADEDWGKMNRNQIGERVFYLFHSLLISHNHAWKLRLRSPAHVQLCHFLHCTRDSYSFVCLMSPRIHRQFRKNEQIIYFLLEKLIHLY